MIGIVGGYFLLVGGGVAGSLLYSRSIGLGINDLETKTNVAYGGLTGLVVFAAGLCCIGVCKQILGTRDGTRVGTTDVEAVHGRENLPADAN
ncbi:hypothetical protein [Endozoicomonas sp. ONNA2]|uniref:hypothetical protein n=1 Tax=Endozoicomonas sp. ONNA2 TaxID=2828741 RepID=UPI002148A6E8|nr:hypothetical protein [Endozoicomonas sp. ONNA2]